MKNTKIQSKKTHKKTPKKKSSKKSKANSKFKYLLQSVRVLDLTRILGGPYCTQILADQGAEIIKVESPLGDETRRWGPPFDSDTSAYFYGTNRTKKSIVLDLKKAISKKVLEKLMQDCDVLVENFKPGDLKKFGFSDSYIQKKFPHLIHCRITGFGAKGPMSSHLGFDAAIQAWSGLMSINGDRTSEQNYGVKMGVPIVDLVTGLNAAFAISSALFERNFSQKGQRIEVSLFDCALSLLHPQAANYFFSQKNPSATGNRHSNIAPYELYPTQTKFIYIACGNDQQFQTLCKYLKQPEWAEDLRFKTNSQRVQNIQKLNELLIPTLKNMDAHKLSADLLELGVPCGPLQSVQEALDHPQTKASKMLIEHCSHKMIASPIKSSRSSLKKATEPPRLGEHTLALLSQFSWTQKEWSELTAQRGELQNSSPKALKKHKKKA